MASSTTPVTGSVSAPPKPPRPRVIGMLGGMSWESTAEYYRLANQGVRDRLGGLHSARIVLASIWPGRRRPGCSRTAPGRSRSSADDG